MKKKKKIKELAEKIEWLVENQKKLAEEIEAMKSQAFINNEKQKFAAWHKGSENDFKEKPRTQFFDYSHLQRKAMEEGKKSGIIITTVGGYASPRPEGIVETSYGQTKVVS